MTVEIKMHKKLVMLPIKQYFHRAEGGNIWSLNLHSAHPSELHVNNRFSTYKIHDTGLIRFHVKDMEIGKDLNPSKTGVAFKKRVQLKNIKDRIVTTHIRGLRILQG